MNQLCHSFCVMHANANGECRCENDQKSISRLFAIHRKWLMTKCQSTVEVLINAISEISDDDTNIEHISAPTTTAEWRLFKIYVCLFFLLWPYLDLKCLFVFTYFSGKCLNVFQTFGSVKNSIWCEWVWISITAIILRRKQTHTHTYTHLHLVGAADSYFCRTHGFWRRQHSKKKTNCECASTDANNIIWSVDRMCIPCIRSHVP